MDLYENTLIGTFLYGLGMEVGARAGERGVASGVDLLQQTPLDQSLADLMIQSASAIRLVEFKRAKNNDPKEKQKLNALRLYMYRHPEPEPLARTSVEIHRLVEIHPAESETILPRTTLHERAYFGGPSSVSTIPELCATTAIALTTPTRGPSIADCARYLGVLAQLSAAVKRPTGGGGTLMVAMRDGIVGHAHVNDISDIFQTQRDLIRLEKEREAAREQAIERWHERQTARERADRDVGDEWER
jgi:hypothetical protein